MRVWFGETTSPAAKPPRTMTAVMTQAVHAGGVNRTARTSPQTLIMSPTRPHTTRGRPRRFTSTPPSHDEYAEATAKPIVTMPANTGARPRPVCRYRVPSRNIAGPAAKYAAETDRKSTRLNSVTNAHLVCRLLLEKKNTHTIIRDRST